jgi:hypothetical protein
VEKKGREGGCFLPYLMKVKVLSVLSEDRLHDRVAEVEGEVIPRVVPQAVAIAHVMAHGESVDSFIGGVAR